MRICLLSARFPPQRCGVGDYTYFLACALARMGYQVDVLTSAGELDPLLYPLAPKLRVHRVVRGWGLRELPSVIQALRALHPNVLVIQYTPHAFHSKGITFAINVMPLLLRATTRLRVVTNFHELYIPFDRSLKHCLGALWQRAMAFVIAHGSHVLTATASDWPRRLRRIGVVKPITVIPVGSNIPRAETRAEQRVQFREKLLGTSNGFLLGGFGALHDRDVGSILEGLEQLRRERQAKLVWIGPTCPPGAVWLPMEAATEGQRDKRNVLWTGPLSHPEVSRVLSACDVVILPFIDGISTRRGSAVTALQHGLPLLTTRDRNPDSCFVHGKNVYLVPVGDGQALADGLLELVRRPELRTRLSQGALALHDTHFAWDVVAREVVRVAVGRQPERC